ncbi:hypothetical protein MtrunA17_Chr5g0426361 [Medicago truncatula]|uniref:Uncharacterized protein n=1 Tax=Medicago truncatula TaxID=3880 RepID=G7KBB3_MEDTR|nr:hypothetical protein MTR_5g064180 [Medicago truncatula]RHN56152.1 hypothetical protein MtrunA17_Chr5g0426361 [Medicago truncatula]
MAPSSKSQGRNFSSSPPPPIDSSSLPSDVSVCHGSKRKKRKTSNAPSTRTNAADTNRQSRSRLSLAEPSKKLPERKARVGGKPSDNAKKEMALRVRSKGAGKSKVESISKLFSSSERGKSISGSCKPQPLKFSTKPKPLENVSVDEASPKSSSPAIEPQQPLTDEEDVDITRLPNYITIDEILENIKLASLKVVDPIEEEKRYLGGMQCNCEFNKCDCLRAYYESVEYDSDYVFTL